MLPLKRSPVQAVHSSPASAVAGCPGVCALRARGGAAGGDSHTWATTGSAAASLSRACLGCGWRWISFDIGGSEVGHSPNTRGSRAAREQPRARGERQGAGSVPDPGEQPCRDPSELSFRVPAGALNRFPGKRRCQGTGWSAKVSSRTARRAQRSGRLQEHAQDLSSIESSVDFKNRKGRIFCAGRARGGPSSSRGQQCTQILSDCCSAWGNPARLGCGCLDGRTVLSLLC